MNAKCSRQEEKRAALLLHSLTSALFFKKKVAFKTSLPLCQGRELGGVKVRARAELDEQHLRLFGSSSLRNPRRNSCLGPPRFPLLSASGGGKQIGRQERSGSPNVFYQKQSVSPAALIAIQRLEALNLHFSALLSKNSSICSII